MQELIVYILIAIAVIFTILSIYRSFHRLSSNEKSACCGGSDCDACAGECSCKHQSVEERKPPRN